MNESLEALAAAQTDEPLPGGYASLANGGDPLLPERWQGERASLTMPRDWIAIGTSWREGEKFSGTVHPVLAVRHTAIDAKRLAADLARMHGNLEAISAIEWRRILDCAFVCGIKGWSNLHRNTLGDGEWRPLIPKRSRYKLSSKGTLVNVTTARA